VENIISGLLKHYENGNVSRRDLIQGLTMLAGTCATASAAGLQGNPAGSLEINPQGGFKGDSLNHIGLLVTDLDRSAKFYERLIGATVVREPDTHYPTTDIVNDEYVISCSSEFAGAERTCGYE
jgi:hypothetical protein